MGTRFFNPFGLQSWGATESEQTATMIGDDLVIEPAMSATRSISIAAAPEHVFPWLRQMGYGRAGWYSYDWIDNFGRESAREIHPQWQALQTGDPVPAGPLSFTATTVRPNRALCLLLERLRVGFSLAFELNDEAGGTRLVSRARARIDMPLGSVAVRLGLEPGDGVMVRRQLLGIKDRAETLAAQVAP